MRHTVLASSAMGALVLAACTAAAAAPSLQDAGASPDGGATYDGGQIVVRDLIGRLVIRTSDRSDIAVQVEPGAGLVKEPEVSRSGGRVLIEGEERRVKSCYGGPGDGSLRLHGGERRPISDFPRVIIDAPRSVSVQVDDGVVFGDIGDVGELDLEVRSCGDVTVGQVAGAAEIGLAGSGDAIIGDIGGDAQISLAGSGDVQTGRVGGDLGVALKGSGDVDVAYLDGGTVDAALMGSGDIVVRGGEARDIDASIMGSGDVVFDGVAGDVDLSVMGSGDVQVRKVTGRREQSRMGSGSIVIAE